MQRPVGVPCFTGSHVNISALHGALGRTRMCRWTAFRAASSPLDANRNSTAVLKSFQISGKFPANFRQAV
jgi:hypothetical protein